MLTSKELKQLLHERGLRLTKRLGQNHLIDPRAIQQIINTASIGPGDTVIEIGAGFGALTEPLAAKAGRVIALEVDRGVYGVLAERLAGRANLELRHQDALEFPWASHPRAVVVGAIPYHITSPIILALAGAPQIQRAVLIVQEEVARRLAAKAGAEAYGRLSVLAAYAWKVEPLFRVPPSAFFPAPRVASTCLRLTPHAESPVAVNDSARLFEVVAAGFHQRRKMLANALEARGLVPRGGGEAVLACAGLPPRVRAEQVTLAQFAALVKALPA